MKALKLTLSLILAAGFSAACSTEIPLVFDKENTSASYAVPVMKSLEDLEAVETLPDPLAFSDGSGRVRKYSQWERRRAEILAELQHYEVGFKPDTPRECIKARMSGDTLIADITVNGETLTIRSLIIYPEGDGPFPAVIGIGMGAGSLPPQIFKDRNIAMIAFPFWEVMSHTQKRGQEPLNRLYPDNLEIGSYAAWRVSETLGNVETLGRTNYSWFKESMRVFSEENVKKLPFDHHELCALVAPRALLVFGNPDYEWLADEAGYVSCVAARKVWEEFGIADRMGYSFAVDHMHCMLPESQWPELEAFVDRFLLGKDVPTEVLTAPMYEDVDVEKWINW